MKLLLAIALTAALASGLVACGGDDSNDSTAGSAATTTQETTGTTTADDDRASDRDSAAKKAKEPGEDRGPTAGSDDGKSGSDSSSGDSSPAVDSDPADDSGGSSTSEEKGSSRFGTPGGRNSVQNFGEEADAEELEAASAVVLGFMRARAKGDWGRACTYLAAATLKPIEQLASRAPELEGKDCAGLLAIFTGSAPASSRANTISGGIDSLRVKGEAGFALYHGTDGKDYFLPLVKEDGEWKAGALAPAEFPS